MVKIISIFSAKGGVGKTTIVSNLGIALASRYNRNTVVIDCNLTNPHLGLHLGTLSFWPVSLNNVLRDNAHLDHAIQSHTSGLDIIPSSFTSREIDRLNLYKLRSRIRKTFSKTDHDFVILDSSPGLSKESLLTLRCSDEIIFVATPHIPAIVDISKVCQILKGRDSKPVGIILNRVKNEKYELSDEEIGHFTDLPILARIPEDDNILKSTNFKTPVVSLYPQSPATKAFLSLAAGMVGEKYIPENTFLNRLKSIFKRKQRTAFRNDLSEYFLSKEN